MEYRKASEDIQVAWDTLTTKWSAEIKPKYFNQIYLPLISEANDIYQRNKNLEDYAESCVNSLRT